MDLPDVLAVGEVMLDVTAAAVPRRGERRHAGVVVRAGGSPVTAALAASAFGARAAVLGRVGDDAAGRLVRGELEHASVDARLAVDETLPTGTFAAFGRGVEAAVVDRGANARLSAADLPDRLHATALFVSGYTLLHEDTRPAGVAALERSSARWVVVDAALASLVARASADTFLRCAARANVLLANGREAEALTGATGTAAARALAQRFEVVCVKLGAAGAVAVTADGAVERPSRAAGGAVGDGDAFAGGLLAALAAGAGVADAVEAGNEAAAAHAAERRAPRDAQLV